MKTIKVGFCGAGTVGGGAIDILGEKEDFFAQKGFNFIIPKILVKDPEEERPDLPSTAQRTGNYLEITEDPEIDVVVEVIGGTTLAWDIVSSALKNKKSVITANKALISTHFEELLTLLQQNPESKFGFEASVGGGLPLISSLQKNFTSDKVESLAGILNGTTNFILSKMEQEGASYEDVLKEAQEAGFAEADPTADVDGWDIRSKILILNQLVTGKMYQEKEVFMQGMRDIEAIDFDYAHFLNSTIKMLGTAQITDDSVGFMVSPFLISQTSEIAQVHGASNIVQIGSAFCQKTSIIGEGAGKYPTGNSIITDLLRVAQEDPMPHFNLIKEERPALDDYVGKFYIRFYIQDQVGIVKRIGELCEQNNISIDSIVQLPIDTKENLPFVITTTEGASYKAVLNFCEEVTKESFCNKPPFCMPVWEG